MKSGILLSMGLAGACLAVLTPGAASAQATRTWVSGVGNDANPCSRTAPCKTFAGAISKTAAAGEISVLDPGGFGAVTITKSITLSGPEGFEAGVLVAGTNGIVIAAGATDSVTIRALYIEGLTVVTPGLNGIKFQSGGVLNIQDCVIHGFRSGTPNGSGILFAPSSGATKLLVSNTLISDDGAGGGVAGIDILPTGTASVTATLDRVQVFNNVLGIRAASNSTTGTVSTTITDSKVIGNTAVGITNAAGGSVAKMLLNGVVSANNGGVGVRSVGGNSTVRISRSEITGNSSTYDSTSSGGILTYGDNDTEGNTTDNAATLIIAHH